MRVGIIGATGRMGALACRAVVETDGLELVAAVGRSAAGRVLSEVTPADSDLVVASELTALTDVDVEVAIDLTGPESVGRNLHWLLEHGIHAVVAATGLADEDLEVARRLVADGPANALVVPNSAIGAVLLMRFAEEAARHLPHVEIIELHHDRKAEAPAGTALLTAERMAAARTVTPDDVAGDERHPGARGARHHDIRVHAVRLPGLVAHQEVIFGAQSQTLRLRHDTTDREAFMPGLMLACQRIAGLEGLQVGLEHVL